MIDAESFQRLTEVFQTINRSIEASDDDSIDPQEIYDQLDSQKRHKVSFVTPGDTEVRTEPISEYAGVQNKWDSVLGLDSSNTRTIRIDSGEVATASLAKFGIDGDYKRDLRKHRSLNAVVFSLNPDFDLQSIDTSEVPYENLEMIQLPRDIETDNVESWVQGISLLHSEFAHVGLLLDEISDVPLLIDGPVYSGNFFWYTKHQYNQMRSQPSNSLRTPLNKMPDKLLDIFQHRVDTIERYYTEGTPLAAVVKTANTSVVLDSIREEAGGFSSPIDEEDVRWHKDMTFFNELLRDEADEPTISHTPWMKEEYNSVNNEQVEFFKNNKQLDLSLHNKSHGLGFDAYKRAFFYVRVPMHNYSLRVETPLALVEKMGDDIKQLVLYQIAADLGVPGPIVFADDSAEISEEAREQLKKELRYSKPTDNYNEKRGYHTRSKTGRE